jgi:hypothetical protein
VEAIKILMPLCDDFDGTSRKSKSESCARVKFELEGKM